MKNKNIRIQLAEDELEQLSQIAEAHECVYRGKVSLSRLLSKVANGEIELLKKKRNINVFDDPLVEISFKVISNLNGTISLITQKIAKFNGNIYGIKATEYENTIRMSVSLYADCDLYNLAQELTAISISNVEYFNRNHEYKIEEIMEILNPSMKEQYVFIKNKDITFKEGLIDSFFSLFGNVKLIQQIEFCMGISMKIQNSPGRLADLTKHLCNKDISVNSIEQDVDIDNRQYNKAHIYLSFIPKEINHGSNNLKTINQVIDSLEQFDYIEPNSIKRITANYLSRT